MTMTHTPPPPPPPLPPPPGAAPPSRAGARGDLPLRLVLIALMVGMGVYSSVQMPVKDTDGMRWDDAVIGVVGIWVLAALVIWGITRMRGCRLTLWRVASTPGLTASLLGLWVLAGCGAIASHIT